MREDGARDRRVGLNRNHDRRDELLGARESRYSAGIKPFEGLTRGRLAALVEEGFADPEERQNEGPSVEEFLRFMARWPAVRARGYAVSRRRPDYRVTLDGIECALGDVPEEDREKLRSEFALFARGADDFVDEPGRLFAWWD